MKLTEEIINQTGVLKLVGRLDAAAVKLVKENVETLVTKHITTIVMDMSDVDFIDSSGLGCLVSCMRLASKENGDIKLASLQEQIRSLLELTRLHRVFQIYDNRESAINSF